MTHFRGSELQNYFTKVLEDNLLAIIKPQYVDSIPTAIKGKVDELLTKRAKLPNKEQIMKDLELEVVRDSDIAVLSGGELQRFAIAILCVQDANIYMFDEPSSYLDIKQRMNAARVIRNVLADKEVKDRYVIVVEHDLSVLDYLSDFVCCLYGVPGVYGVITMPFSVRDGINAFLGGFIPTENLRFREQALTFKVAEALERDDNRHHTSKYGDMKKTVGKFTLEVRSGQFTDSEIIVLLGQNGTGKTTLIRMLAGGLKPDEGDEVPELNISYKPQKIAPKFEGTVRELLHKKIQASYTHPQFVTDVMRPLKIEQLMDHEVQTLSGGELQRVAIALCLGAPADVYLLDEPSAYLDSEQRIFAAKVIKRYIFHAKKTAFVVEHDFIMATYLADRVIVYEGTPSVHAIANAPQSLLSGMNAFLAQLDITFRRDPANYRPRINKWDSVKDKEQKEAGTYFYMDD